MKKTILAAAALVSTLGSQAQDVKLPAVDLNQKSATVVEALATRHSVREYSDRELSAQELSNLCWAACGMTRDAEHRTAPTAMNRKEIRLYVFTQKAVFEYEPVSNTLKFIAEGDQRRLMAGGSGFKQDFVMQAPVTLLMVVDLERFGSTDQHAVAMSYVDAGIVSENINLYCQAVGLATVPRATMDSAAISKLLNLSEKQVPLMNNPVGWPK